MLVGGESCFNFFAFQARKILIYFLIWYLSCLNDSCDPGQVNSLHRACNIPIFLTTLWNWSEGHWDIVLGRRITSPSSKDGPVSIPGACEYVRLRVTGEIRLHMEFRWLISWPSDGARSLDYSGESNVVTRVFTRGRGLRNLLLAQENQRDSSLRRSQSNAPGFSEAGGIQP